MNPLVAQQLDALDRQVASLREALHEAMARHEADLDHRKVIQKKFWDAERRAGIYEETYSRLQGVLEENAQLRRQVAEARERVQKILAMARELSRKAEMT